MMLLLYTRQELQQHLSNISIDTVGTGIMGKLGKTFSLSSLVKSSVSYISCQVTRAVWG